MPETYYLHQTIWDPNASPPTGIYQCLLDQQQYPELYSLVKSLTTDARPYWDMARVEGLAASRNDWISVYFRYPSAFTTPIDALWSLYNQAITVNPEDFVGDNYYDPRRIKRFISLIAKQREFCYQFLNAYISRTKTHHEVMFNRLSDAEHYDGVVNSVWNVAKSQWLRLPSV